MTEKEIIVFIITFWLAIIWFIPAYIRALISKTTKAVKSNRKLNITK